MSDIEVRCKAFAEYYKKLGKEYVNGDGVGKFTEFCDENGIEEDGIEDELQHGPEECLLCDFDPEFPFKKPPKDEEAKKKYIYGLLMDPENIINAVSGYPEFTQSLFEEKQNYDEIRKLYEKQCPVIYNKGAESDIGLLHLWSIQQKYGFPYLQHLVDSYDRYRVKHPDKTTSCFDWCTLPENKHFRIPAMRNVKISVGNEEQTFVIFASHGMQSVAARVSPKLLIPNFIKIDDSLQVIIKYILGATRFISGLLETAKKETPKETLYPFQIDLCIFLEKVVNKSSSGVVEEDYEDDDEEEENNQTAQPEMKYDDGVDYVGDIKAKLKANGLKFVHKTLKGKTDEDDELEFMKRQFTHLFLDLHGQSDQSTKNVIEYLHRKRFIAFVDRRHPKKGDDLYFTVPPPGQTTGDIPSDAVPEWGISAAKTCILPSLKKFDEDAAVGNLSSKHLDEMKDDKDETIGTDFPAAKMLTISFQANSEREIKARLFWNGQTIRFFGDDIRDILPTLFVENAPNKEYMKNRKVVDEIIEEMNKTIADQEFALWLKTYGCTE